MQDIITSSSGSSSTSANAGSRVSLLDSDGALTLELEQVLLDIFTKYATNGGSSSGSSSSNSSSTKVEAWALKLGDPRVKEYVLTDSGLEAFGRATNGQVLPPDQIEEMKTFLDCDDHGNLLFSGFVQLYQLQTENDEGETWNDLKAHGYNESLQLVA